MLRPLALSFLLSPGLTSWGATGGAWEGPMLRRVPTLGLTPCRCHLEIVNTFCLKDTSTFPICTGPYVSRNQCSYPFLLFCFFLRRFGFEEPNVLLVSQVVHSVGCVQGVLVARVMPVAELQFLSLDLGLTLLLYGVATMLLVKGHVNRSGHSCEG